MWGLTTIAGRCLLFNLLTQAIGGAAAIGKTALETGAGAMSGTAGEAPASRHALGIDWDDLLAPVNRRLRAENKPRGHRCAARSRDQGRRRRCAAPGPARPRHADRVDRAAHESVAQRCRRYGRDASGRVRLRVERARVTLAGHSRLAANRRVARGGGPTGKAFWGVFGALLIGLVSAVLGAMAGVGRRRWMGPDRGITATTVEPGTPTFVPRPRTNP